MRHYADWSEKMDCHWTELNNKFKLSIRSIKVHVIIKSAHLKYGIYKPREVEHPKKKLRKRTRFFIGCSTSLGL